MAWIQIKWDELATLSEELKGKPIEGCDRGRLIDAAVSAFEVVDGMVFIGLTPALPYNQEVGGHLKGGGACLTGDGRLSLKTDEGVYMIRAA